MASNINPNNIDTAYPIAGQDNDSQGFRDNFTNIKTNFGYTVDEINDLQNNVILKNGLLGGITADEQNIMDGTKITSALMQDMRGVVIDDSTGVIDVSKGAYYSMVVNNITTISFIGFPTTSNPASVGKVIVDIDTSGNAVDVIINLPANTIGSAELEYASTGDVLNLPPGRFIYEFFSPNGGDETMVTPVIQHTI